ncbi:MAG: acylphosphatase [Candidatus Pacearchaeota archaeon]|jgi:acylphosphatase
MKKAAKIVVIGTVPMLFFGNYIKEHADNLDLKGFVRNVEDGSAEILIEGEIDNVDRMYELCKEGPKHAVIRDVQMTETKFQDFKEFQILHI